MQVTQVERDSLVLVAILLGMHLAKFPAGLIHQPWGFVPAEIPSTVHQEILVLLLGKHWAKIIISPLWLLHSGKNPFYLLHQVGLAGGAACGEPNPSHLAQLEQRLCPGWNWTFGGGFGAPMPVLLPHWLSLAAAALWGCGGLHQLLGILGMLS